MKQIKFNNISKVTTVAAIASVTALFFAGSAQAEAITKPMSWTPPSGQTPGPIEGTSAVLEKGPFGAAMAIKSSGLTPGDVVTIWWVAIQKHQNCKANPCSPKEAMADGMENDSVVRLAASGVVSEDGKISLASFLPSGEVEGNFFDTTLHSPETAEYHLPMHNHGPLDPSIAESMLSSFRGGCTDESLPPYYPTTALMDGTKGSFNCKTVQVAAFEATQ
jgi:hypothetical protein